MSGTFDHITLLFRVVGSLKTLPPANICGLGGSKKFMIGVFDKTIRGRCGARPLVQSCPQKNFSSASVMLRQSLPIDSANLSKVVSGYGFCCR